MDVGEQRICTHALFCHLYKQAIAAGTSVEGMIKKFTEECGDSGAKILSDEKIRELFYAIGKQIRRDEKAVMDRREGF